MPTGVGAQTRFHPKYKTGCPVTNWAEYGQALVERGDISPWIMPDEIKAWNAKPSGHRVAPQKTEVAIGRKT